MLYGPYAFVPTEKSMPTSPPKYMTLGEGGLAAAMTVLAFVSIVIAAKAYTPEYAFHAYLFAAASVAAVFAICNRYFEHASCAVTPILLLTHKSKC